MVGNIRILCYGNGSIKNGEDGVYYDGGLIKMIRLNTDANYKQFLHVILERLGINPDTHRVDVFHRCLTGNQGDRVQYVLVSISDDDDVLTLVDYTQDMGSTNIPELYILTSNLPMAPPVENVIQSASIVHETHENELINDDNCILTETNPILEEPLVDMDKEFDDRGPFDSHIVEATPSPESPNLLEAQHPPMSPHISPGRNDTGHEFSSQRGDMLFEDPVLFLNGRRDGGYMSFAKNDYSVPDNWKFSDEFKKGMKFNTKHDLIYAVKMHHIVHHHNFNVDESTKAVWSVHCSQKEKGCAWRLRACLKVRIKVFVVTKVQNPHICVDPLLSQDHPRLDSTLMARFFVSHVRETPDVKVSFLKAVISERFGYKVPKRRIWDAKRKAIELVYGHQSGLDKSHKRARGRPRSTCIHDGMEIKKPSCKTSCGICEKEGHNRRTCPQRNMGMG